MRDHGKRLLGHDGLDPACVCGEVSAAGFAVLIFDYRHLGESEGQPRQLVEVRKQRMDLQRADALRGGNLAAKMKSAQISCAQLVGSTARLLGAAAIDAVRGFLGLSPRYIQVYGRAGEAFFTDPSLAERFRTVEENSPTWENRVAPRFLFGAPRYREGTMSESVSHS